MAGERKRRVKQRGRLAVYHQRVRAFKRQVVEEALAAAQGNRSEAARELGIDRAYLYYLMESLRVQAPPAVAVPA